MGFLISLILDSIMVFILQEASHNIYIVNIVGHFPTENLLLNTVYPMYLCVHIHRSCIFVFNQPQLEDIGGEDGGCHVLANVYYVVRPVMFVSVLNMYGLFFLVITP